MLVGSQASVYPYSTAPVAHQSMLQAVVESETKQGTKAVLWGLSRAQVSRLSVFLALPSPALVLCLPRAVVCSTLCCPLMAVKCSYTFLH